MKIIILLFGLLIVLNTSAQKITNIVLFGPDGITEDIKKAESFVVVKQFPEYFERLDYKMGGPVAKIRCYKDTSLTVLHGNYYEYRPDGTLIYSGKYKDNKKTDNWWTFDDTGKVIHSVKYEDDVLIETIDLNKKDTSKEFGDEREANFPGGNKAWIKYLVQSLEKSETANHTLKGGKVMVNFKIGMDGLVQEAFISKSVEFALDEDSLEIIRKSPKWNTAWQNGRAINAYRRQPITYAVPE